MLVRERIVTVVMSVRVVVVVVNKLFVVRPGPDIMLVNRTALAGTVCVMGPRRLVVQVDIQIHELAFVGRPMFVDPWRDVGLQSLLSTRLVVSVEGLRIRFHWPGLRTLGPVLGSGRNRTFKPRSDDPIGMPVHPRAVSPQVDALH